MEAMKAFSAKTWPCTGAVAEITYVHHYANLQCSIGIVASLVSLNEIEEIRWSISSAYFRGMAITSVLRPFCPSRRKRRARATFAPGRDPD